jgi:hypothetical protein
MCAFIFQEVDEAVAVAARFGVTLLRTLLSAARVFCLTTVRTLAALLIIAPWIDLTAAQCCIRIASVN